MESNESVLAREVVSIGDRKKLGRLEGLRIDCDTCAVSHFIIRNLSTGTSVVLPFRKSLAVGDTFVTIKTKDDILPVSEDAERTVNEGFQAVGVEVFSKAGNRLGIVESYEFDPTYGTVTTLNLGGSGKYTAESFLFFSPDFIFIDDGAATAADLRGGTASEPAPAAPVADETEPVAEATDTDVEEAPAAPAEAGAGDDDGSVREFLLGNTLIDDVESEDGAFSASKGDVLTEEILDEAAAHDALLLLLMGVDA